MKDFFISYRRPDLAGALWVQRELDRSGYSVWIQQRDQEELRDRRAIFAKIDDQLRQSHILIACLSYSYIGSDDRENAYEFTKYEFDYVPRDRLLVLLFEWVHFESALSAANPVRMYGCWREERKRRLLAAARAKRGASWKLPYEHNPRRLTAEQVRRMTGRSPH